VKFTYDKAERLETVTDLTVSPNRPLKTFAYGTSEAANERTNGRLLTGTRYTYQLVNGVSFIEKVDETYAYAGPGGRTTSRTTQLSAWTSLNPVFAAAEGFTQSWTYDDLGNVKTIGYPDCFTGSCQNLDSARTVTNTYANGWLTSVAGSGGAVYASAIAYHSNGMLKKITRGNGVSLDIGLAPDSMSRPASFSTSGAGTSNWISGNYAYDGAGNVTAIGNSRFTYDHVSRLKTAEILVESGTGLPFSDGFETGDLRCWAPGSCMTGSEDFNQTFTYDPFGNLKEVVGDQGRNTPTSSATNRLTEATYDVAGNLLTWNGDTYEYDPLGTMTRRCPSGCVAGAPDWRYIYTADDERLFALQVTQGAGFGNVWTLRDLGGSTLREYDATATWAARDYIYRDGQLLASNEPGEGDRHFHLDHLGTPRLITNAAGAKVAYHSYLPFGEEATAGAQDAERRKFTGHERDTMGTSGVADDRDNMHARQYNPLFGRSLSIDRGPATMSSPQTWNRYAYVRNRPLVFVDPDGNVVSLSSLTEEQRKKLLSQLADFTGNIYGTDKAGNLVLVNIGDTSSLTATNFLSDAIKSETVYSVVSTGGKSRWDKEQSEVEINFSKFDGADYGSVDPRTFNLGSTLVHELYHGVSGKEDLNEQGVLSLAVGWTGPVVDFENKIRAERGLPLRESYIGERTFWGREKIRFNHVDPKDQTRVFYVIR